MKIITTKKVLFMIFLIILATCLIQSVLVSQAKQQFFPTNPY